MKTTSYWRPEPRLNDGTFYALLVPACVYVAGVIVYGAEAMKAGAFTWSQQGIGSALMVIGGEAGTLATAMEVFRKQRASEVAPLDWLGLFVSLVATLGALFVVFARQTTLAAGWVAVVRSYGPLVLLLCSGLDFYANVAELGFYRASYDERWSSWNDARHVWEQKRASTPVADVAEMPKSATSEPPPAEPLPFVCPFCDRVFATQQGCNAHQRAHNGHKLEEVRV